MDEQCVGRIRWGDGVGVHEVEASILDERVVERGVLLAAIRFQPMCGMRNGPSGPSDGRRRTRPRNPAEARPLALLAAFGEQLQPETDAEIGTPRSFTAVVNASANPLSSSRFIATSNEPTPGSTRRSADATGSGVVVSEASTPSLRNMLATEPTLLVPMSIR